MMNTKRFATLIQNNEEILLGKILAYAKAHDYVKYTSTLKEAWRLSITGLSSALADAFDHSSEIPEMKPDEDFTHNPICDFGIMEARRHRTRGITLGMFLGLMKYYHQSYTDLVDESDLSAAEKKYFTLYIHRFFDHIEISFSIEWAGIKEKEKVAELQTLNRQMTNEKNKFLTIFESIYDPVILIDQDSNIEHINDAAAEVFFDPAHLSQPDTKYYGKADLNAKMDWIQKELQEFIALDREEIIREKTINTQLGRKTFMIKFKKMLDFSEKYRGTVIIFSDITERIKAENELKRQHEKLMFYAFTDPMTGVSNRRTGLMTLEQELSLASIKNGSVSVCFLDIDGLKIVNDTYGHAEGDHLITTIVMQMKAAIRKGDLISRLGGDEFLIIFPDTIALQAQQMIDDILIALQAESEQGNKSYRYTFSYGIVEVNDMLRLSANDVIKLSDKMMYQNKMSKKY